MDNRSRKLLNLIMQNEHIQVEDVEAFLHVNPRQIRYILQKINETFVFYHIPVVIKMKGTGFAVTNFAYLVQQVDIDELEINGVFSQEERIFMIIIYLYCYPDFVSQVHLQQFLDVSKNSVHADLTRAQVVAKQHNVDLLYDREAGYILSGSEWKKRGLLLYSCSQIRAISEATPIFKHLCSILLFSKGYEELKITIDEVIARGSVRYIEQKLDDILLQLYFIWSKDEVGTIKVTEEQKKLLCFSAERKDVIKALLTFFGEKSTDEQLYAEILLQITELDTDGRLFDQQIGSDLYQYIAEMTSRFTRITGMKVKAREQFTQGLYGHLRALYYRIFYEIPCLNVSAGAIKRAYPVLFSIVSMLLKPFEQNFGGKITEDELAYITLHFAAGYTATEDTTAIVCVRAMIFCANGIGTSVILENQLQTLFPEFQFEIVYQRSNFYHSGDQFDLIFSTTQIYHPTTKTFIIPTILTYEKRTALSAAVITYLDGEMGESEECPPLKALMKIIRKHAEIRDEKEMYSELSKYLNSPKINRIKGRDQPMLEELLTESMMQFVKSVETWEEAITLSAQPLLKNGSIEASYITAMIENVKAFGTYILVGNMIAIPHARPEQGVNAVGMSFLKLEKPVALLGQPNKQVQIFFTLAAIDGQTHLRALAQLSEILLDDSVCQKLFAVQNAEELRAVISTK
ncbi:MAG: BglG family transcription antiterminator [Culicoidibacterales bacterium]